MDGIFAKINKAQCMNRILSNEEDANLPPAATTVVIVDGNVTFYMKDVPPRMLQMSQKILKSQPKGSQLIFSTDSYHPGSIKSAEREHRGCREKYIVQVEQTKRPHDWSAFLTNQENKE